MAGLVDLLGRRKVAVIAHSPFTATTSLKGAWDEAVRQSEAQVEIPRRGDVITFDGEPEVALRVLFPPDGAGGKDAPIVLKVEYEGIGILLASSMSQQDETFLLSVADDGELTSDVLKVAQ